MLEYTQLFSTDGCVRVYTPSSQSDNQGRQIRVLNENTLATTSDWMKSVFQDATVPQHKKHTRTGPTYQQNSA